MGVPCFLCDRTPYTSNVLACQPDFNGFFCRKRCVQRPPDIADELNHEITYCCTFTFPRRREQGAELLRELSSMDGALTEVLVLDSVGFGVPRFLGFSVIAILSAVRRNHSHCSGDHLSQNFSRRFTAARASASSSEMFHLSKAAISRFTRRSLSRPSLTYFRCLRVHFSGWTKSSKVNSPTRLFAAALFLDFPFWDGLAIAPSANP